MALSHCNCTQPGAFTDDVEAHYKNIWIGQGDQRNNINIAHCETGESGYQYTIACNYSDTRNESATSSIVIPLIILGVAFLISLAVIIKMHLRIKELEEGNSKQEKGKENRDQIGPSVIEMDSNQNI